MGTSSEPIVTVGVIAAAVSAVLALLASFAVPITDAQQTAVLAFIAVVAPLVVIYARRWTRPESEVVAAVQANPSGRGTSVVAGPAARGIADGTLVEVTRA